MPTIYLASDTAPCHDAWLFRVPTWQAVQEHVVQLPALRAENGGVHERSIGRLQMLGIVGYKALYCAARRLLVVRLCCT